MNLRLQFASLQNKNNSIHDKRTELTTKITQTTINAQKQEQEKERDKWESRESDFASGS